MTRSLNVLPWLEQNKAVTWSVKLKDSLDKTQSINVRDLELRSRNAYVESTTLRKSYQLDKSYSIHSSSLSKLQEQSYIRYRDSPERLNRLSKI